MQAYWLVLTYDLLEDRRIDDVIIKTFFNSLLLTSVTHSAAPRVPLFCSYHILTSSVIYYWRDARQLGIYLLIRPASLWLLQATLNLFVEVCQK